MIDLQSYDKHKKYPMRYKDTWFRGITAVLAAHFIVVYGIDETFFELLLIPGYYRSVAFSFVIAFALFSGIRAITIQFDKKYDWLLRTIERTMLQILFGFILPAIAAFLLAFIYFRIFDINILNTPYLRFDYPVILILLVLTNLYYLAYYFFLQMKKVETQIASINAEEQIINDLDNSSTSNNTTVFIINRGAQNIPIRVDEIAYFYRKGIANFLCTKDGTDYVIPQPLDDVEAMLDRTEFFRVNRQVLVKRKSCIHFENLPFSKIELFVEPPCKYVIIISQKRVKAFKAWIKQEIPMSSKFHI